MGRINEVSGQFFIKRPGDVNGRGFVPAFLAPVEVSAEAQKLIRDGAEAGYWQAYIPAALMPETLSLHAPYEITGEIVMERVAWEQVQRGTGKIKTTMINNAYILVRSVQLLGESRQPVQCPDQTPAQDGGTFGDVPPASELAGREGKRKGS